MTTKKVGAKLTANTTDFERKFAKATKTAAKLGKGLSIGLAAASAAAALGLTKAVEAGVAYETTMAKVKGVSKATTEEFASMTEVTRRMGETTEWSASQAADGLQFLSMAGFDASESVEALPGVLDLATAGSIDLGLAADIASNALTAMRLETDDLTRVNNTFISTITSSNTDMEMMAESFKYAAPAAAGLGYEIETVSALIGKLGNAGIQGSMAGTALSKAFLLAGKTFDYYGESAENADGSSKDLIDALELLEKRGAGASEVMQIFGDRAGKSVLALLGQGSESVRKYITEIENAGDSTKELADIMRDTVEGDFKTFKSTLESLGIDVFDEYRDEMRDALKDATAFLREHKGEIIEFVGALGAGADYAAERMVNFFNAAQLLGKVKEGELSLWEAATMGPQEAKKWLAEYHEEQKRAPLQKLVKQIQLQHSLLTKISEGSEVWKKHTKLLEDAQTEYDMLTGGVERLAEAHHLAGEDMMDDYGTWSDGLADYTQYKKEQGEEQTANLVEQLNDEGGYFELHNDDLTTMYIEENLELLRLQKDRHDKQEAAQKKANAEALQAEKEKLDAIKEYTDPWVDGMVDAWVAGEDMKVAAATIASDMLLDVGKNYLKQALPLLFEGIGQMLGAWLGVGVGKSQTGGSTWQEMIGQGVLYLGAAGAGILAGKALGDSMFAEGGWIGENQGGGVINQGSGVRDDVFLGLSNGGKTANYGMGGEFVINRDSTAKHLSKLYAINEDRFASGGMLDTSVCQGDPYAMAEDMNAGGFSAFMSSWIREGDVYSAIAQAVIYYAGAMGGMLGGKLLGPELGDMLFANGGQIGAPARKNYFFGGFDPFDPIGIFDDDDFNPFNPFDVTGTLFGGEIDPFKIFYKFMDELPGILDAGMISTTFKNTNRIVEPFMRDIATPDKFPNPLQNYLDGVEDILIEGTKEALGKAIDPLGLFDIFNTGGPVEMANGGILTSPIIAGEAGPEVIAPLHAGPRTLEKMHNDIKSVIDALGKIRLEVHVDGNSIVPTQKLDARIRVISDSVIFNRNDRGVRADERFYI